MEHPIGEESAIYINSAEQSLSTTVVINADDSPMNPDLLRQIKKQLQDRLLDGPVKSMLGPVERNVVPLIRRDPRSSNSKSIFEVSCSLRVADSFVENVLCQPLPEVPSQGEISEDQIQVQVFYELSGWFSSEGDKTKLRSKAKAAVWERLQPFCADLNERDLVVQENHVLEQLTDPHMTAKEALERGLIFVLSNEHSSAPSTYKSKSVTRAQCKSSVLTDSNNAEHNTDESMRTKAELSPATKFIYGDCTLQDLEDAFSRALQPFVTELKVGFDGVSDELVTGLGDISKLLKDFPRHLNIGFNEIVQLLEEHNRVLEERHNMVVKKVFNVELNQKLSRCKWVLDFNQTDNAQLQLNVAQQEHLDDVLKETKFFQLLETLDEELRPTLTDTVNTDAVCLIRPNLDKVHRNHFLKFVTNDAETALREWMPNCPQNTRVLLLGQTITLPIAPQGWLPDTNALDASAGEADSITKYLATQKTTPDGAVEAMLLQNFIDKMLQLERMVTAWRVKLTLAEGDSFPLDNIVLVLDCIRAPTKAQITFIKAAVPTVHALLEAKKLIFMESDAPRHYNCLDGVYVE